MSLYSFGLEPLSCHTWNKDRTRKWNRQTFSSTNVFTPMCSIPYSFSIIYGINTGWDHILNAECTYIFSLLLLHQCCLENHGESDYQCSKWTQRALLHGSDCTSVIGCLLLFLYLALQLLLNAAVQWVCSTHFTSSFSTFQAGMAPGLPLLLPINTFFETPVW